MSNAKNKILIQLDTDPHPSSFDAVVATDAGVDTLLQYGGVNVDNVESLVHGAMFTRGPGDLKNTAIFVGGSDVALGEAVYQRVLGCFFGPMRVSVMLDSNGSNTTAAAAVLRASKHIDLAHSTSTILAGTGPVGQRVARLLLGAGGRVRLSSRSQSRAESVCESIGQRCDATDRIEATNGSEAVQGADAIFACGAAGISLLSATEREQSGARLAIDLNAVPPVGLEGVDIMDKAKQSDGQILYGAIGVGGTKMKIHHGAVERLFQSNDQQLDAESIYAIGLELS